MKKLLLAIVYVLFLSSFSTVDAMQNPMLDERAVYQAMCVNKERRAHDVIFVKIQHGVYLPFDLIGRYVIGSLIEREPERILDRKLKSQLIGGINSKYYYSIDPLDLAGNFAFRGMRTRKEAEKVFLRAVSDTVTLHSSDTGEVVKAIQLMNTATKDDGEKKTYEIQEMDVSEALVVLYIQDHRHIASQKVKWQKEDFCADIHEIVSLKEKVPGAYIGIKPIYCLSVKAEQRKGKNTVKDTKKTDCGLAAVRESLNAYLESGNSETEGENDIQVMLNKFEASMVNKVNDMIKKERG